MVVHRSDGSGATWIFTNYLSKVSQEWKDKVGNDKSVAWPVGIGGKGNEGVASYVKRINGSIGHVEYAYALQNRLPHVRSCFKITQLAQYGVKNRLKMLIYSM
jgi:phosphate transport system substrate-binding protein